jgi:LuxR family quorum-sensing transcriptional regulator LasR
VQYEEIAHLLIVPNEQAWAMELFRIAKKLGFDQTLYAVLRAKNEPHAHAFVKSNYNKAWRMKYDKERMSYIDPVVNHSCKSTTPLLWTPALFKQPPQIALLEEASAYGLGYGLVFPIHGPNGEVGLITFVSEGLADPVKNAELMQAIPILAIVRDFAFESSMKFVSAHDEPTKPNLTPREQEVLKWTMAGKSMWEIARILNCSESNVNFHITNVRRKFGVNTKHQAIIQAIKWGIVEP